MMSGSILSKHALAMAGVAMLALCITACDDGTSPRNSSTSSRPTRSEAPKADNTARNAEDRKDGSVTPTDQGESEADRRITADIRRALTSQNLSVNGQNCKVITKDGVVTLRGPVASQDEKDAIAAAAQNVAGVRSVKNELEVVS